MDKSFLLVNPRSIQGHSKVSKVNPSSKRPQRVNKSNQLTIPRYTDKPIYKLYGQMDGPMDKKTWSGIELG